jgi:transcriptional regulator with XRE-family HTH domain
MSTNAEKGKSRFPAFQRRFNELRGELSQDAFAKKIGVARPTVGFYENGERLPDALTLVKIARACGVSVAWLLGESSAEDGNADVMAVEQRLGLSPKAQAALERYATYGGKTERATTAFLNYLIPECVSLEKLVNLGLSLHHMEGLLSAYASGNEILSTAEMKDQIDGLTDFRIPQTATALCREALTKAVKGVKATPQSLKITGGEPDGEH